MLLLAEHHAPVAAMGSSLRKMVGKECSRSNKNHARGIRVQGCKPASFSRTCSSKAFVCPSDKKPSSNQHELNENSAAPCAGPGSASADLHSGPHAQHMKILALIFCRRAQPSWLPRSADALVVRGGGLKLPRTRPWLPRSAECPCCSRRLPPPYSSPPPPSASSPGSAGSCSS